MSFQINVCVHPQHKICKIRKTEGPSTSLQPLNLRESSDARHVNLASRSPRRAPVALGAVINFLKIVYSYTRNSNLLSILIG